MSIGRVNDPPDCGSIGDTGDVEDRVQVHESVQDDVNGHGRGSNDARCTTHETLARQLAPKLLAE